MKSDDWDESTIAEYRTRIGAEPVSSAFDLLVAHGASCPEFSCSPKTKGVIRSFRYHTLDGASQPYSFIVNRESLLFYVRLPGAKRLCGALSDVRKQFGKTSENTAGETTIRIQSIDDAKIIISKVLSTKFDALAAARTELPNNNGNDNQLNANPMSLKEPEMRHFNIPATRVRQGTLTLYTTSLRVSDLVSPGFYNVETLDPDSASHSGYQRLLNKSRAKTPTHA